MRFFKWKYIRIPSCQSSTFPGEQTEAKRLRQNKKRITLHYVNRYCHICLALEMLLVLLIRRQPLTGHPGFRTYFPGNFITELSKDSQLDSCENLPY